MWRPALFFACRRLDDRRSDLAGRDRAFARRVGRLDLVLVALFAVTLPWYVIGFWNADHRAPDHALCRDPVAAVTPVAGRVRGDEPITASTAILLCIRNEPPERVGRLLEPLLAGLAARGVGDRFHLYVLSDTSRRRHRRRRGRAICRAAAFWRGRVALTYRRRTDNVGFKAGNIARLLRALGQATMISR